MPPAPQALPAMDAAPGALVELQEGPAAVREDRLHGRESARRPLAWRDADLDRLHPRERRPKEVDNGKRQRGQGARAGDNGDTPFARYGVEARNSGDKGPTVGEVY